MMPASEHRVGLAVRTLVAAGFRLAGASRKPGYIVLHLRRYGFFQGDSAYIFAICERALGPHEAKALAKEAEPESASVVIVDGGCHKAAYCCDWMGFMRELGGAVETDVVADPAYGSRLTDLAFNKLPADLGGDAPDLFELYVHGGLQFAMAGKTIRYGQERQFEALPDGASFGHDQPVILYDAKAYADGYPVDADSLRQFASYVSDFNGRYAAYMGPVYRFVVISGAFSGDLQQKASDFYAMCGVGLSYLPAAELAKIVALLDGVPRVRLAVDWRAVLSQAVISSKAVEDELARIRKDRVLEE